MGCIAGKLAAVDTVFVMATRHIVSSLVCESDAEMEMQHIDQQERLRALLRVSPSAMNPGTICKLSASAAWVLNEESFGDDYNRLVDRAEGLGIRSWAVDTMDEDAHGVLLRSLGRSPRRRSRGM